MIVGALQDAYVSPQSVLELQQHLEGSEVRCVRVGLLLGRHEECSRHQGQHSLRFLPSAVVPVVSALKFACLDTACLRAGGCRGAM